MRIVVKIGSAVLIRPKELKMDIEILLNITEQIKKLKDTGHEVLMVTSGAVASCDNKKYSQALRAAIGQPRLMSFYTGSFSGYGIESCQLLFIHDDLTGSRRKYTKELLLEAINNKVVPIINANDGVTSEELDALKQYADNDVLTEEVASLISADLVFILTDQKGLIDFSSGEVIGEVKGWEGFDGAKLLVQNKDKFSGQPGKGGMISKIRVAETLCMAYEIEVRVIPGRQENAILDSLAGKKIGTIFRAKKTGTIFRVKKRSP